MPKILDHRPKSPSLSRASDSARARAETGFVDLELQELTSLQVALDEDLHTGYSGTEYPVAGRDGALLTMAVGTIALSIAGTSRETLERQSELFKAAIKNDYKGDDIFIVDQLFFHSKVFLLDHVDYFSTVNWARKDHIGETLHSAVELYISTALSYGRPLAPRASQVEMLPSAQVFLDFLNDKKIPLVEEIESRRWVDAMPNDNSHAAVATSRDGSNFYFSNAISLRTAKLIGTLICAPILLSNLYYLIFG